MTAWESVRVVVTGGSRGIGLGIAERFAAVGARVAIVARTESTLVTASSHLAGMGLTCETLVADVSHVAGCTAMADEVGDVLGGLDVLCANAGIYPVKRIGDLTETDLGDVFAVNVHGTILSLQACVGMLSASGRGRVVMTSSITGPITGYPGLAHYAASKSAQLGFMRSAALELAPYGITVNAILPGSILTEGLAELGTDAVARMIANIPQRRLGTPADIGDAALYFASEEAGFVTGQALVVDGGQTLPELPGIY